MNKKELWDLYQTAKTFRVRPSDLLAISDRYAALCLDRACGEFGRTVEGALHEIEGKTKKEIAVKTERTLRHWLDMPQRYRSPAGAGVPIKRGELTD